MEELKKHFYDEHKGLHYTLVGDYSVSYTHLTLPTN